MLLKQTQLALEKYTFKQQQVQATKYFQIQATRCDKLSLQVNALYNLLFGYLLVFFVDAINWKLLCLFLLASLE